MFSNRLKELRKKLNMTQTEFAKEFNIANGTVGNWESGNRQPDYITINKIADFFGVSIDYLLGRTDFSADTLSERETNLVNSFRKLDESHQKAVLYYASCLVEICQHKIDGGYIVTDPDADVTNEDIEGIKNLD